MRFRQRMNVSTSTSGIDHVHRDKAYGAQPTPEALLPQIARRCTDIFRDGTALGDKMRRLLRTLFSWTKEEHPWALSD